MDSPDPQSRYFYVHLSPASTKAETSALMSGRSALNWCFEMGGLFILTLVAAGGGTFLASTEIINPMFIQNFRGVVTLA